MGLTGDTPRTRSNKRLKSQIDICGFRVNPLFSAGSNDFPTLPDSLIYLFSVVKKRNGKKNSRWRQKKKQSLGKVLYIQIAHFPISCFDYPWSQTYFFKKVFQVSEK